MKELPPSRTADQFQVRFPDGLRDQIAESAKQAGRSMNAEIVTRLQASLDPASSEAYAIPAYLRPDLDTFAAKRGLSVPEAVAAVTELVVGGAPQMLVIHPAPGMSLPEMHQLFAVAREHTDPMAHLIVHPMRPKRGGK